MTEEAECIQGNKRQVNGTHASNWQNICTCYYERPVTSSLSFPHIFTLVMPSSLLGRLLEGFKKLFSPPMPEWKRKKEKWPRLFYNIWAYANPTKAPPPENLLDRERAPPARPLPLEFPDYKPPSSSEPLSHQRMKRLRQTISQFKKPSDASDALFAHFNINLETDVPLSSFVPKGYFEQRPFLFDTDLTTMLKELDLNNEDAYREVLRIPPLEGRTKPRLAYSRNFFASLEDMSRYWDDSKDDYYKVPMGADGTDPDGDHDMKDANGSAAAAPPLSPVPNTGYDFMASSRLKMPGDFPSSSSSTTDDESSSDNASLFSSIPAGPQRLVYKGHRLGNAAQMPPTTRLSAIRSFTKMLTHKFNCRDFDNGVRERLKIRDVLVPPQLVMYSFAICRVPNERELARGRFVEGPVMGVSCRHEVVWRRESGERLLKGDGDEDGDEGKWKGRGKDEVGDVLGEEFDFLKEVGGLLALALQRARGEEGKGKKEEYWQKEVEGWWWAKKERWGGGETKWGQLSCEGFEDEDPSWSPRETELQMEKREKEEAEKKLEEVKSEDLKVEDLMAKDDKATDGDRGDKQPLKKRSRLGLPERMRKGSERSKKQVEAKVEYRDGRRVMFVPGNKRKWYEDWKEVRPNSSPWDDKVIYKRIGKEEGEFDDVFQIGSVNHHVCLTRMRVSRRYLRWIEKGVIDEKNEGGTEEDEDVVKIQRSPWFDLFDVEQRKEFLVGLWRVMCWLNRNEVSELEVEKMEKLRKEAIEITD